jgi:hypothetical protein
MSCSVTSPLVHVNGRPTCTGRLAAFYFSNALCACGNAAVPGLLSTGGFDSTVGAFQPNQPDDGGASVGVNGDYKSAVGPTVGGSFSVAGQASALPFSGTPIIRGDFWMASSVSFAGVTSIGRDAWVNGNITGFGPVNVAGTLHHSGTVIGVKAASDQLGPVVVPKPCACGSGDLLDIAGLVEAAHSANDNDALRLSPGRFAGVASSPPVTWNLACGRAYLTSIGGTGSIVVKVSGKSAVFIDGSINLTGSLQFVLADQAEVDVFVKDDVSSTVALTFTTDRPSAARLYVGGSQPIAFRLPWVGNLYAPRAAVSAPFDISGSLFTGDFSGAGITSSFVYDRAILKAGSDCSAPPLPAGACAQYGDACVSDVDCCSLLTCTSGSCGPLLQTASAAPASPTH